MSILPLSHGQAQISLVSVVLSIVAVILAIISAKRASTENCHDLFCRIDLQIRQMSETLSDWLERMAVETDAFKKDLDQIKSALEHRREERASAKLYPRGRSHVCEQRDHTS